MKKPIVILKNIKTFRGMEGYGLNADIYINGVKSMFVMDDANGGEFNYEIINTPEAKANAKLLEDYIKTLPDEPMMYNNEHMKNSKGEPMYMKVDLDLYIDNVLLEQEEKKNKAKFEKKIKKLMETSLVIGVPNADTYRFVNFKKPLAMVDKAELQRQYIRVKSACKNGEVVLNDNLKGLIIMPI